LTAPLAEDVVIAGSGHVNLWLRSETAEADLEIVLSEITPEGDEVRIQNGIARAGFRTVDEARSDELTIQIRYGEEDYEPLPIGEYVLVRVPIFPVSHPLRAGSQLRLQINTPGRDLPLWFFENRDPGSPDARYAIGRGGGHASSLVVPVLPAGLIDVPAERPPCGTLRGQPCRAFLPSENQAG
jgi:predicted acyl esterase